MQCFVCETYFEPGQEPAEVWCAAERLLLICAGCARPYQPQAAPSETAEMHVQLTGGSNVSLQSLRVRSARLRAESIGAKVKSRCIRDRSEELLQKAAGIRQKASCLVTRLHPKGVTDH